MKGFAMSSSVKPRLLSRARWGARSGPSFISSLLTIIHSVQDTVTNNFIFKVDAQKMECDFKWGIALFNRFPKHVKFLDTTLRDGEQTPGVSLVPENKLRIAQRLDELGVDIIEAGFAAVSEGEMEAVSLIAKQKLRAQISSCARGTRGDIEAVAKSGADSIHLVIPTSDIHLKYKLNKTREQLLKITEDNVQLAKGCGLIVELSAEDATRTELDFLKKFYEVGVA